MFRSTYRVLGFRDVEYSVYNIYIYIHGALGYRV